MNKSKRDTAAHKTARNVRGTGSSAIEGLQCVPKCKLVPDLHTFEYSISLQHVHMHSWSGSKQMATNVCLTGKL